MDLLEKLWDDTVAGPRPEKGLGKLRKYRSFSPSPSDLSVDIPITRSITILKTSNIRNVTGSNGSASISSSPSAPDSPFTPTTPRGNLKGMRTKSEPFERAEPKSPTVYDW